MEMKTIGYDPYIPEERFKQLGVEPVDLDTLLERSDYITMHTPLTKETTGLIGKDEIAKMKDGVRVINVSRGAVLDINALADALKSGHVPRCHRRISDGTAYDGYQSLRWHGQCLITPHLVLRP